MEAFSFEVAKQFSGAKVILKTIPKVWLNDKQFSVINIFNDTLRENVLESDLVDLDMVYRGIPVRDLIFFGENEKLDIFITHGHWNTWRIALIENIHEDYQYGPEF